MNFVNSLSVSGSKYCKHSLGRVDLIPRTRLRNILITPPVVVIEVGISNLNYERVVVGMGLCLVVHVLYSPPSPKTHLTHIHEPIKAPPEHSIEIRSLIRPIIACFELKY